MRSCATTAWTWARWTTLEVSSNPLVAATRLAKWLSRAAVAAGVLASGDAGACVSRSMAATGAGVGAGAGGGAGGAAGSTSLAGTGALTAGPGNAAGASASEGEAAIGTAAGGAAGLASHHAAAASKAATASRASPHSQSRLAGLARRPAGHAVTPSA